MLLSRGYLVKTAEDGYEALKQAETNDFDLILLDMIMPGLSGIETMKRLMEEDPRANVIAMTAFSDRGVVAKAMAGGARKCFLKPIDIESLENTLKEAVFA